MENENYYTVKSLATEWKVHENTVRGWINQYGLPAITLPTGTVRIRRSDFEKWARTSVAELEGRKNGKN